MAASPIYSRFNSVAPRLIQRFDQGSFKAITEVLTQNPNPTLPPSVTRTETPYMAVAKGVDARAKQSDPILVNADLEVIIDGDQGYVPEVGAHVSVAGREYAILQVRPIPAMSGPPAYKFYVGV